MSEFSGPFTNGLTDGGPWSPATWWRLFRALLGPGNTGADVGVVKAALNELAVTSPGADEVEVDTGQAFVQGTLYENTATLVIATARPSVGTTGKRLVLRRDAVAGGVRATVISSADGTGTLPALTQDAEGNYDIPLASFTHATNGTIGALTDEREFIGIGGGGMKRTINGGHYLVPAFSDGTSVTTASNQWEYGSYVEMIAAAAKDMVIDGIALTSAHSMSSVQAQVGIGAGGSEVHRDAVREVRTQADSGTGAYTRQSGVDLVSPIFVPAGSRVAVRTGGATGGSPRAILVTLRCINVEDMEDF